MTLNSRSAKLSSPNVKVQDVPNKPTIGAPAQNGNVVEVPFTPAATGGQAAVYRAVSTPGGFEGISYGSSPVQVSGLNSFTSYTFTVRGETTTGATSGYSSTSPSVTPVFSDMELISTVIVGSGGASTITFDVTGLGASYKHLQLRVVGRSAQALTDSIQWIRLNGDTANNYATHQLLGNGTSVTSLNSTTTNLMNIGLDTAANTTSNAFGAGVIDFLDPFSTSKNKTVRSLSGFATPTPYVGLKSGLWMSTAAVTSITIYPNSTNYVAGSRFSLYGIKG